MWRVKKRTTNRVLERGEWFEGKKEKENERMKLQTLIEHLNHSTLHYSIELVLQRRFHDPKT